MALWLACNHWHKKPPHFGEVGGVELEQGAEIRSARPVRGWGEDGQPRQITAGHPRQKSRRGVPVYYVLRFGKRTSRRPSRPPSRADALAGRTAGGLPAPRPARRSRDGRTGLASRYSNLIKSQPFDTLRTAPSGRFAHEPDPGPRGGLGSKDRNLLQRS